MNIVIFLGGVFTGIVLAVIWAVLSMSSRSSRIEDERDRWAKIQKEMGHENKTVG